MPVKRVVFAPGFPSGSALRANAIPAHCARPSQISTTPSSSLPWIVSTCSSLIPSAPSCPHRSRSAASRCLYANRSVGRAPSFGFSNDVKVDRRGGNDAVLYVTSAALSVSRVQGGITHITTLGHGDTHEGMGNSQSSTFACTFTEDDASKPFRVRFSSMSSMALSARQRILRKRPTRTEISSCDGDMPVLRIIAPR